MGFTPTDLQSADITMHTIDGMINFVETVKMNWESKFQVLKVKFNDVLKIVST